MKGPTLTHPSRWAAWVLVRLRGRPPDIIGSAWRVAAHIYRDRCINTMQGLRDARADIRRLQAAFETLDDSRPLSGGELDSYIEGLRDRCSVLAMHVVDVERQRDRALAEAAAYRRDLQAELDGGAELRKHLGARESEPIWTAADRVVAEAAALRQAAIDLVNQLTALRMPDESTLWRLGGQPLERDYQAFKAAIEQTRKETHE